MQQGWLEGGEKPQQQHCKQKWAKAACVFVASGSGRSLGVPSVEVTGRHGKGFVSAQSALVSSILSTVVIQEIIIQLRAWKPTELFMAEVLKAPDL